jgi:transposase-like protein
MEGEVEVGLWDVWEGGVGAEVVVGDKVVGQVEMEEGEAAEELAEEENQETDDEEGDIDHDDHCYIKGGGFEAEKRDDHSYTKADEKEVDAKKEQEQKKNVKVKDRGAFNAQREAMNFQTLFESKITKKSISSWQCKECKKTFTSETLVNIHAKKKSCSVQSTGKIRPRKDTTCRESGCDVSFPTRRKLKENEEKVHPKPYTCHICNKPINRRRAYHRHMKEVHSEEPVLNCDSCGWITTRSDKLRTHKMLKHPLVSQS